MVSIRWTTHNPPGLGEQDVEMAEVCERLAVEHGVKVEEVAKSSQAAVGGDTMEGILDDGCKACSMGEKP